MLVKHLFGILSCVNEDYPAPFVHRLSNKQITKFNAPYISDLEISWELDDGRYVYLTIADMKNHISISFDTYINDEHNVENLEVNNLNYPILCDIGFKLDTLLSNLFR